MATSIAVTSPNFESFIFAQDNELKTNSLKIAEAFGKRHADVLRSIEQIITQVSDIFGKRNFALTQNEVLTPTGGVRNDKMYELTKDGFIMVVMSFTGKKAMTIKEAYINAFNMMYEKLFSTPLLESSPITKTQYGVLSSIISAIATSSGKEGTTKVALWSRFSTHFKISSSKDLPAFKFDEAKSYLESKKAEYDRGFTLAVVKKDDLQTLGYDTETKMFAVRALEQPQRKTTWNGNGHVSMILGVEGDQRLVVHEHGNLTVINKLNDDDFVGTFETVVRELKLRGYVVMKKDDLADKLSVLVA